MCVNILIVDPIHQSALTELSTKYNVVCKIHPVRKELIKLLRDAEILVIRSGVILDEKIIDESKNLKLIARAGSGLDNIPVEYCKNNNLHCIDLASKLDGKKNYWFDAVHTTRLGSTVIAETVIDDLIKIIKHEKLFL